MLDNTDLTEKLNMGENVIELTYQNTIRFKDGKKNESNAVTTRISQI